MILQVIKNSIISSNLTDDDLLNGINCLNIEIDDSCFPDSNKIYKIKKINNRIYDDLLCKIYDEEPKSLITIINKLNVEGEKAKNCETLKALPLFLFKTFYKNQRSYSYAVIMRKVNGYTFDKIEKKPEYVSLPLSSKLKICCQLGEAMEILREISIIHGDFGFDNMVLDISDEKNPKFYIIDFDLGSATDKMFIPPGAMKDQNELIPFEIWQKKLNGNDIDVDRNAENWTIAATIHCILFSVSYYFFVNSIIDYKKYINYNNKWPHIDKSNSYFRQDNFSTYDKYLQMFKLLSPEFQEKLSTVFQKGFNNPSLRYTPKQWKTYISDELNNQSKQQKHRISVPKPQPNLVLNKPTNINPINSSVKSSALINFNWSAIPNAIKYEIIIVNSIGDVYHKQIVNDNKISINFIKEDIYYWKVRAGDNSGNWSDWSNKYNLTIKKVIYIHPRITTSPKTKVPIIKKGKKVSKFLIFLLIFIFVVVPTLYFIEKNNPSIYLSLKNIISFLTSNQKPNTSINNTITNTQSNDKVQNIIGKVNLLTPEDFSILSPGSVKFEWIQIENSNKYEFALYNHDNNKVVIRKTINTTETEIYIDKEGNYYWCVRAGNNNNWGEWSNNRFLQIIIPEKKIKNYKIYSIPSDADVWIDNQYYGKTPLTIDISVKVHNIKIKKEGYEEYIKNFQPEIDKEALSVSLKMIVYDCPIKTIGLSKELYESDPEKYKIEVKQLQRIFSQIPNIGWQSNYTITGDFGYGTEGLLRRFQKGYNLNNTGIIDEPTKNKLCELWNMLKVTLYVFSDPPDAYIYIDGDYFGKTPLNINLMPGNYWITMKKAGYIDKNESFKMEKDKSLTLNISLSKQSTTLKFGYIKINSNPKGARIYINNQYINTTPIDYYPLTPGSYEIKLTKSGYEDYMEIVEIKENQFVDLGIINLISKSSDYGYIFIYTDPSYANVYIDNKLIGTSPIENFKLTSGSHLIKIIKEGYKDYEETININSSYVTISKTIILEKIEEIPFSIKNYGLPLANEKIIYQIGSVNIIIDNNSYEIRTAPDVVNGKTCIPLISFSEAFGIKLNWFSDINGIEIQKGDVDAWLNIGSKSVLVSKPGVGDHVVDIEVEPYIKNDEILVPVRCFVEIFDLILEWEPNTRSIIIGINP